MTRLLVFAVLLGCVACSPDEAPAEPVAEAAVAPTPAATPLTRGKYAPRDECGELEGARAFRDRFEAAVRARDTDALVALAAADIILDFGGGGGATELRRQLEDPSGLLWNELTELPALGCAVDERGELTIPWFFAQDFGEIDPYEILLVIGEDVPVRATADPASRQLDSVSWDIVSVSPEPVGRNDKFHPVVLADGRHGYIEAARLRHLLDYRLIAASRNGKWGITVLIAGD